MIRTVTPHCGWIDRSSRRVHYVVTTWDANRQNLVRSVPLGQGRNAPSVDWPADEPWLARLRELVPDARHLANIEQPRAVGELINGFLPGGAR